MPEKLSAYIVRLRHEATDITGRIAVRAESAEQAQAANSRIASLYEELRKAIDEGSESMTHDDALKQISYWQDKEQAQAVEPTGLRDAVTAVCEGWTLPDGARKMLESALWTNPAPPPASERAKVGDSRFESWYSELHQAGKGSKQIAREAYEAGLNEAKQVAVLTDIEQYRMQMSGISTAAFGHWSEVDEIHPDYDTLALRDVARLYVKYDRLFKEKEARRAQQVAVPLRECHYESPTLRVCNKCGQRHDKAIFASQGAKP